MMAKKTIPLAISQKIGSCDPDGSCRERVDAPCAGIVRDKLAAAVILVVFARSE